MINTIFLKSWDSISLKEFLFYLKEKGIYNSFYYNFCHHRPFGMSGVAWENGRKRIYFEERETNHSLYDYLNYSFRWASTKEGHEFWHKIMENKL